MAATKDVEIKIDDAHLPTTFRTNDKRTLAPPSSDLSAFLKSDLSVERLEAAEPYLWLAGLPHPPRTLSTQTVLGRTVVPTPDTSLHLVWTTEKIFIKPLPRYLTSTDFFKDYLRKEKPFRLGLGLLYSYAALIATEYDFESAGKLGLLPSGYQWDTWQSLTRQLLEEYPNNTIYSYVPSRYRYGELRLSRLDKIYRVRFGRWRSGYSNLTGFSRYLDFFVENTTMLTAVAVYIMVILTAMQVALSVNNDSDFHRLCLKFAKIVMFVPVTSLTIVAAVVLELFFYNLIKTLIVQYRTTRALGVAKKIP